MLASSCYARGNFQKGLIHETQPRKAETQNLASSDLVRMNESGLNKNKCILRRIELLIKLPETNRVVNRRHFRI